MIKSKANGTNQESVDWIVNSYWVIIDDNPAQIKTYQ